MMKTSKLLCLKVNGPSCNYVFLGRCTPRHRHHWIWPG